MGWGLVAFDDDGQGVVVCLVAKTTLGEVVDAVVKCLFCVEFDHVVCYGLVGVDPPFDPQHYCNGSKGKQPLLTSSLLVSPLCNEP